MFLDTNVLVSAFATRGVCADLLRLVLLEHELVTGEVVLKELRRILAGKLKMPEKAAGQVIDFLREEAEVVNPERPAALPERDPDDRWIAAAALKAKADVLVTGDQDLLQVGDRLGIRILDPRGFWEQLKG